MADDQGQYCGEVVASDTHCLRVYLTCGVDAKERRVKIRRGGSNHQDAYPTGSVWVTHVTFQAMATAPPEQLQQRRPKEDRTHEPESFSEPEEHGSVQPPTERRPKEDRTPEPESLSEPEEHGSVQPPTETRPKEDRTPEPESLSEPEEHGSVQPPTESPPWQTTDCAGQRLLMRLRNGHRDDRSQTQMALVVKQILSIRQRFLHRNRLNESASLDEHQRKSIWNEDLKAVFTAEMYDHPEDESLSKRRERCKIHGRYRAWIHLAFGVVNTVREILFQSIPLHVSSYILDLLPTQWR